MAFWSDKHVLITGASSGMGLAAAALVAADGARVSLVARDAERLRDAARIVADAHDAAPAVVSTYPADVSHQGQVEDAVTQAVSDLGPVDALLTCAGFCEPRRFVESTADDLTRHVQVNLLGTMYAARAVAPMMVERRAGSIGLVSSMGGLVGVYGYAGYSASKFGVTGFAEVLRSELKPHGVSVTLACPPNMDTPGYARERALEPAETSAINSVASTVAPRRAAAEFLRAMERGRFLVLHGTTNKILYRAEGLWPELFYRFFDSKIASVHAQGVAADARH